MIRIDSALHRKRWEEGGGGHGQCWNFYSGRSVLRLNETNVATSVRACGH